MSVGWVANCRRSTYSFDLAFKYHITEGLNSITPQVNAGPLAYAQAFLDKSVLTSHPHKHIEKLQQVYRSVVIEKKGILNINR